VPRPKLRTPMLRDQVLQAAVTILSDQGAAGFTTRRVAQGAQTSPSAIYELFTDKQGLVREVFYEGFRTLEGRLDERAGSGEPRADLLALFGEFRRFFCENPELAKLMFSRPFVDFDPGPEELKAGDSTRTHIVAAVRRCAHAGMVEGDETDIAHVLLALAQGLALQEAGGWLGTTKVSKNKRWSLAFDVALRGLVPTG
jgi:AcrR family transcriptional regulator